MQLDVVPLTRFDWPLGRNFVTHLVYVYMNVYLNLPVFILLNVFFLLNSMIPGLWYVISHIPTPFEKTALNATIEFSWIDQAQRQFRWNMAS